MPRPALIAAAAVVAFAPIASAAPPPPGDIHAVDFKNFSFADTPCGGEDSAPITVKNGLFEKDDEDDRVYFEIQDVVYGDVTGDGVDEAVVQMLCNTGGSGQFTDGAVYTMRGGKPVLLGTLGVGDRADGGLYAVEIRDRVIYHDRFGQDGTSGACCPQYVETYAVRWNGSKLVDVGKPARRAYQDYQFDDSPGPHTVKFLRGTSSATLAGSSNGGESYRLGARAGQSLAVRLGGADDTASVDVAAKDGTKLGTVTPGHPGSYTLPATGDYVISVRSKKGPEETGAVYRMDVQIK